MATSNVVEARQVAWLERRYRELEAETLADLQGHIRISARLRAAVRDEAIIEAAYEFELRFIEPAAWAATFLD